MHKIQQLMIEDHQLQIRKLTKSLDVKSQKKAESNRYSTNNDYCCIDLNRVNIL